MARNILRETCVQVMHYLAHSGEATQYQIKKGTGLSYASVHEAIKDLIWADLIWETRQSEGPGPLPNRFFKLTFEGLVRYFILGPYEEWRGRSGRDQAEINKDVRKTIQRYQEYLTIFSEWDSLEKMDPDFMYVLLYGTATDCIRLSGPPGQTPERRPEGYPTPPYLKQDIEMLKERSQKRWKRLFATGFLIQLLNWLREDAPKEVLRGTPNEMLYNFTKDFFESQKARKTRALKRLGAAQAAFLGQFGPREEEKPLLRLLEDSSVSANY